MNSWGGHTCTLASGTWVGITGLRPVAEGSRLAPVRQEESFLGVSLSLCFKRKEACRDKPGGVELTLVSLDCLLQVPPEASGPLFSLVSQEVRCWEKFSLVSGSEFSFSPVLGVYTGGRSNGF